MFVFFLCLSTLWMLGRVLHPHSPYDFEWVRKENVGIDEYISVILKLQITLQMTTYLIYSGFIFQLKGQYVHYNSIYSILVRKQYIVAK